MRFSSFSLLSLLPLLIEALPFDNSLGNELGASSYQRQDLGLFHGPRKYISGTDVGDSQQLIPFVIWLPRSTLLRSSPRYRRGLGHDFGGDSGHGSGVGGDSGHDSDVCGDPGHGSDVSSDPVGHGSDDSGDTGHDSDVGGDPSHGSSDDPGHDQSDDNEGLVPLSTGVVDQSDRTALSDDTDPSDDSGSGSDPDDDTDAEDTDTDPSDDTDPSALKRRNNNNTN